MIRPLRTDAGANGKHALGRLAESDRDDPLPLGQVLAGTQEEWHAGPTPIVDMAFQGDEGLCVGFGIDALLRAISQILPANHVLRLDRQHAAKDLVLLLADRARL